MIDVEAQIYTTLATALRTAHSGVSVSGEYVKEPSKFPFVSVVESDNYVSENHLDSAHAERFATLMYEVNVYSNKGVSKKSECKAIMATVDDVMHKLNFIRLSLAPVPNMDNASIYRMTARYRAETDGTNIYRR